MLGNGKMSRASDQGPAKGLTMTLSPELMEAITLSLLLCLVHAVRTFLSQLFLHYWLRIFLLGPARAVGRIFS